jgi:hypothetical protein
MINIDIRYIDRTCLEYKPFYALVKKYSKDLKNNIRIVFDKRIVSMGTYIYDYKNKIHIIKISPEKNRYHTRLNPIYKTIKLDLAAEKYNLIGTVLHEIKHALQLQSMGSLYERYNFNYIKEISNQEISEWYSECEIEARIFESRNLHNAIEYYNRNLKVK